MAKEITFKAGVTNIVAFEQKTGLGLMEAFTGNIKVSSLVELVKACSDATDEDINAYVAEHGLEALMVNLTKALADAGFLPKEAVNQVK